MIDNARFYEIGGKQFPSVTTILSIIDRSGPLVGWAVREERTRLRGALLEVLARPGTPPSAEELWARVEELSRGEAAAERLRRQAADVGTIVHAEIERILRTQAMTGAWVEPHEDLPAEAQLALQAWRTWVIGVELVPEQIEVVVYDDSLGYAGKVDCIGSARCGPGLKRATVLIDWKTSKAIYPEARLQAIAYLRASQITPELPRARRALVVRVPKDGSEVEVVDATDTPFWAFQAALELWRWHRQSQGLEVGAAPRFMNW